MNTSEAPELRLRVLGGFSLEVGRAPRPLNYEKGRALLAYLALEPSRAHARKALAQLFWPGLPSDAARTNLRQVLHDLRRALGATGRAGAALRADRESVRFDGGGAEIDAVRILAPQSPCVSPSGGQECAACITEMEESAALQGGELLADTPLDQCADFESWLLAQREHLHLRAVERLTRLADCLERLDQPARALPHVLRLRQLDPWNEDALRRALRLYARCGRRAEALEVFERARRALQGELGIEPAEETLALADAVRDGTSFAPAAAGTTQTRAAAPATLERRQVTVLQFKFDCPGVDDPDEAYALLAAPQARCAEVVRAHGGYLAQVRGASLLAYFGYPRAEEDAARRALGAAVTMRDLTLPQVEMRVGAHTGLVLASCDGGLPDATGNVTGLAMRLRQEAAAGEILLSATTQRMCAGYFEGEALGARRLIALARPVSLYRLRGPSPSPSRLAAARPHARLVGREKELANLLEAWQQARVGKRGHVLLRGEAGIGKSRLVLALKHHFADTPATVRELRCAPEHRHSPFQPVVGMIAEVVGLAPQQSAESNVKRLLAYVQRHYGKAAPDALPLLAGLLGLPLPAPYDEPAGSPQQRRERLIAILLERVFALASAQPLLLVVEDLHWADPSTRELIDRFVAAPAAARLLAVLTARPDFAPSWRADRVDLLELGALDHGAMQALVRDLAPELDRDQVRAIVARADGIALYAEELACAAVEDRAENIPSTLYDLIAARLDAVGGAKAVAQRAATIGREFDLDLLCRSLEVDATEVKRDLARLEALRLIEFVSAHVARFRHVLMRDAAYESQARPDRQRAHRAVAEALKVDGTARSTALLAQHRSAAGEAAAAIAAWCLAGQHASREAASHEALAHFRAGLALLADWPRGGERDSLELDLQMGLGAAAVAAHGYASTEGAQAFRRAMELCTAHAARTESFAAVWGLWASASSRVGYEGAQQLAAELAVLAAQSNNPIHAQQARFAAADTAYWRGEFTPALALLEEVELDWRADTHDAQVAEFGEDAGVTGAAYRSWVLWMLGREAEARAASELSLDRARQLAHPFSLAYALTFAALLACRLGEPARAEALAAQTLEIAARHGFALWQIGATLASGWARAQQGDVAGVEAIRQCVAATREAMGGVTLVVLEPLAEACVLLGQFEEALAVIDEALQLGAQLGDHHCDAVLWCLRGQALEGRGASPAEAVRCFAQALDIVRAQGAEGLVARVQESLGA
ncbi:MAG: AAA family ATPase [Betaproteobacteria bacterium]|nr:AAA family ATPase [Betaproteobacteria bacterium]